MIKIVSDSTSDLDKDQADKYGITIVPLNVYFGDDCYKDWVTLKPEEFYRLLKTNKHHPKTSQPSPEDFKKTFQQILDNGDEVLSIHMTSKMSGTYQSALIAKNDLGSEKVHVFDSGFCSISLGLITIICSEAIQKGKSILEMIGLLEKIKKELRLYFVVDTLEYLQKGGRIGKASALIGSLLNIKPILALTDGAVEPFEKVRGSKKALGRLAELLDTFVNNHPRDKLAISVGYSETEENMQEFLKLFPADHPVHNAYKFSIGAVVGTHTGPGVVGISFISL